MYYSKTCLLNNYNKKYSIRPALKKGDKVYLLRRNVKIKRLSNKLDYRKLGLFKINKVKGLVNYKLKLLRTMKIYSVFYILLLEKVLTNSLLVSVTEVK